MKGRRAVALLGAGLLAGLFLGALLAACRSPAGSTETATPTVTAPATGTRAVTAVPSSTPTVKPSVKRVVQEWQWTEPGFSGSSAITLTQGIDHYLYYTWSPSCDAPDRRQIPMIWGKKHFYTDRVALARLFDGPCNDGRPLLFLNEPARPEQSNITPVEAAHMFYTMTRGAEWPYERWHGPIYAANNLVEDRSWDAEFVRQFAKLYNSGSTRIPEIAGWAVHLYGNYEYGPDAGDPDVVWTQDIPPAEIRPAVYRSMYQLDRYLAERRAEGNATSIVVTEFGLLQASKWHEPPTYYYETTARFMDEYVRVFDRRPEIQAWFWFVSVGSEDEFLDTDLMVDPRGSLTLNGLKWRELAKARQ